jgi:phospholipid/cholesterol/gamma-HCH transport system substrate-binding protein
MSVKKLVTPFRVGLLVLVAGGLLFGFLLFVRKGGLSDSESVSVHAYFRDASGLSVKSRVQIAGIAVGEVTRIELEGIRAKVYLKIRRDVGVRKNASLTKRSESLLGDYLINLSPGTESSPLLEDGDEITAVIDQQGMEAIFASLQRITGDIEQVTGALREVLGGEQGTQSLQQIVRNLVQLTATVEQTFRTNAERIDTILANVEGVSTDVRGITRQSEAEIIRSVENIEAITRDTRSILATVQGLVGDGKQGELKESVATLRQTLNHLDKTLANVEEVTTMVRNGEGTVGALLTDQRLGQRITETVEDLADFSGRLTGIQAQVGLQTTYSLEQGSAKNLLSLRLFPKPDKHYLLEIVDDPRGVTETQIVQTNPPGAGEPVVQRQKVTRDAFKISAQFAKRYYFTTLRFGIIESTGGIGADFHFLEDHLWLQVDAFNFSVEELRYPRLRAAVRANAFDRIFLTVGVDDILNSRQRDAVTGRLVAGQDFFFGGGLYFTDDDLKSLLPIVPTPR